MSQCTTMLESKPLQRPRGPSVGIPPTRVAWVVIALGLLASPLELLAENPSETAEVERRTIASDWAFRPIASPAVPKVKQAGIMWSPIDAFILAEQDKRGIEPAPLVSRHALLRRVTFDVTGLPPTPEEVEAFLTDNSPQAYEKVVDRLLASHGYGERWARHWLDVVRYAETDGFAIDEERPTLWRYRDYVVRAFNQDRPFDRFICEQLAGDEMDAGSEGIVATGFYRLGPWEADNMVPENKRQDYLNEITDAIGSAFLGLTVGCARCHDHKYDPIPTNDFYKLQAFLTSLKRTQPTAEFLEVETIGEFQVRKAKAEQEATRRREDLARFRSTMRPKIAASLGMAVYEVDDKEFDEAIVKEPSVSAEEKKQFEELKKAVAEFKESARYDAVACAVSNPGQDEPIPATHVLIGGSVTSPGPRVAPGFLSAVQSVNAECSAELAQVDSAPSGRRKVLAQWIASPENPLTPRVLVNRLWQYHFGAGIVATANDFGKNGSGASHPELLDYLAKRFIESGWQLKPLHRLLLLSRTYQLSTQHPQTDACAELDPDNRLLWRANFRRLEGEVLRDAMLAVSGRLHLTHGGPGFFEELPAEMGREFPFFKWDPSEENQRARRSLYSFQRRNMVVPMLESFDAADMSTSCARRGTSVTTPQVFALFNSKFAHETSQHFARRVQRQAGSLPRSQVEFIFRLAFGRSPTASELEAGTCYLEKQSSAESAAGDEPSKALADLCLVALNANEFLYLE